jgi:thiosulfate/3-mercaptopyruvate sulfurtransferase
MSEIVVPAAWVAERRDEVVLVDVRDGWEFDGIGHVPGAVNVPFDSFRAGEHAAESGGDESGATGMLPGGAVFADLLGGAGIDREDHVVAYDDHHGVFAARLLVTAELYGHDPAKLHLLDGDFSAWQRERETTSEVSELEPTTYEVTDPAETETPLVDADAVAAAVDDPEAVVVDTREDWEYEEGHVPGAVRLDWRELVDDDTRGLKPRDEVESILEARGVTPGKQVVLYCNTARRISHTYTVLRHLGYPDRRFYEGSLTEWEREGRPLESGAAE